MQHLLTPTSPLTLAPFLVAFLDSLVMQEEACLCLCLIISCCQGLAVLLVVCHILERPVRQLVLVLQELLQLTVQHQGTRHQSNCALFWVWSVTPVTSMLTSGH